VTASNKKYYQSLEANIYSIHTYFKDYDLIVYDLGLTEQMRQKVNIFIIYLSDYFIN
jgi:hypothetical protein